MTVLWSIDPTSEDATNAQLDLVGTVANVTYRLVEMDLTPPEIAPIYAASADTEGDPFIDSRYRNRTVSLGFIATATTDAALQTGIQSLQQKLEKLRREGGTLKMTTQAGTTAVGDVNFASFKPVFEPELYSTSNHGLRYTLDFDCKPAFRGAATVLSDHVETANPAITWTETTLAGDLWGLGKLVIDEDQAQDQWWLVWGVQSRYVDAAASGVLLYKAELLTLQGGSSTVATPAGGWATNAVFNGGLTNIYQSILSSQATGGGAHWTHIGNFRVFARVLVPTTNTGDVSVALDWSQGDSRRFARNEASTFPASTTGAFWGGRWRILDLGQVHLTKTAQGTQRWEARLVASSTVTGDDINVDWLMLVPIDEGHGEVTVRPQLQTPTVFGGLDTFNQTAGDLNTKTATIGGTWTAAAGIFTVDATNKLVTCNGNTGENTARLGATTYTDVLTEVSFDLVTGGTATRKAGIVARWVDASNFLWVAYNEATGLLSVGTRIAAADTFVRSVPVVVAADVSYRISAQVDSSGRCIVWITATSRGGDPVLMLYSPTLATAGALASGRSGLYDSGGVGAGLRAYDTYVAATIVKDAAIFASQSLEVRHDQVIREDSSGVYWQQPSRYEGTYLRVPPAGKEARTARFIVKASRNSLEMPDPATDDISAKLTYTPRYLVLPS